MPRGVVNGPPRRTVIVGAGRAGGSFHAALVERGWDVDLIHHGDLRTPEDPLAGRDAVADLVLLCVPDAALGATASMVEPDPRSLVAHCAGSLGLEVLGGHQNVASVHPLVSLPDADTGRKRLTGAWFAVAGDPRIRQVVDALGGTAIEVPDQHRGSYHAAAVVASNHLVALLAEVQRLARPAAVPLEAYLDLVRGTLDNVAEVGPSRALTGPASRQDWATVLTHLESMDPSERTEYLNGLVSVAALAGHPVPPEVLGEAGNPSPGTSG